MGKAKKKFTSFMAGIMVLGDVFLAASHGAYAQATEQQKVVEEKSRAIKLQDMTSHPRAGMEVEVEVIVRDALNKEGRSQKVKIRLPQREFRNPLAVTLVDLRRTLALEPEKAAEITAAIGVMLNDKKDDFANPVTRERLSDVHKDLVKAQGKIEVLDQAVHTLWQIMLQLEEDFLT